MRIAPLLIGSLALVGSSVQADVVTARVVADDFFSVYVGNAAGTSLTLVGSSGGTLWFNQGAPFTFDAAAGDYIYVAAWDSASFGPPHMWIGEFTSGALASISNTTDWVAKFDNTVKDPTLAQVAALAQSANAWQTPAASMANGSLPYGTLIGGSQASMIWIDVFDGSSVAQNGYALFRASAPVARVPVGEVPEPAGYALLIAGLGLMAASRRRRA